MHRFWPIAMLAVFAAGVIGSAFLMSRVPMPILSGIAIGQQVLAWCLAFFATGLLALSALCVGLADRYSRSASADRAGQEDIRGQLANTAAMLRTIISATPGLIYAKDVDGRFTLVNPATAALIGKPPSEIVGRTDAEVLHDTAQGHVVMANDRRIMESGVAQTIEEEVNAPDGAPCFWLSTKAPLRDPNGSLIGMVGMSVDITDRKVAAVKLDILRNELAHMGRLNAMGELSMALAHELNQPLATIVNHLAIAEHAIKQPSPVASPGIAGRLADATEQAMRAGDIVKRLRTFIESDEPHKQPENVADLVTDAVALVSGALKRRGMSVATRIEDTNATILADRVQIQQVVINLVRNAGDAMENLPSEHREVLVTVQSTTDRKVQIIVEDEGRGISDEDRLELFQRFATARYRESGLGIPISLRIVHGHDGQLTYDSRSNGGARLTATLPMY